jgi:hypothetical protein
MLIEAKYKVNDIVTIALPGGQEVLGKLVSETDTHVTLTRPLTIAFGQQGVTFQPFTVTGSSEGEVNIYKDKIIAMMKTNDDTTNGYRTATSGIVVPETTGLIV